MHFFWIDKIAQSPLLIKELQTESRKPQVSPDVADRNPSLWSWWWWIASLPLLLGLLLGHARRCARNASSASWPTHSPSPWIASWRASWPSPSGLGVIAREGADEDDEVFPRGHKHP